MGRIPRAGRFGPVHPESNDTQDVGSPCTRRRATAERQWTRGQDFGALAAGRVSSRAFICAGVRKALSCRRYERPRDKAGSAKPIPWDRFGGASLGLRFGWSPKRPGACAAASCGRDASSLGKGWSPTRAFAASAIIRVQNLFWHWLKLAFAMPGCRTCHRLKSAYEAFWFRRKRGLVPSPSGSLAYPQKALALA